MIALIQRIDGQLGIALALSVALHAVLFAALALVQDTPAPKVVSSLSVRLSTAVEPTISIATTSDVAERSADPLIEEVADLPPEQSVTAAIYGTDASSADTPTESHQLQIDPASLQAFIVSTTEPVPPLLGSEVDIAEQYRRQFHKRVQRIGQLNYPSAASRLKLSGQLTQNVAINSDGSVGSVGIAQSSGHDELDLAALEIVHQSSPFRPLPPNLPRSNGQFRFQSTWEFRR